MRPWETFSQTRILDFLIYKLGVLTQTSLGWVSIKDNAREAPSKGAQRIAEAHNWPRDSFSLGRHFLQRWSCSRLGSMGTRGKETLLEPCADPGSPSQKLLVKSCRVGGDPGENGFSTHHRPLASAECQGNSSRAEPDRNWVKSKCRRERRK